MPKKQDLTSASLKNETMKHQEYMPPELTRYGKVSELTMNLPCPGGVDAVVMMCSS